MQSKIEKFIGTFFATCLTILVVAALFYNLINFMLGNFKGFGMYGNRGNDYMYGEYN